MIGRRIRISVALAVVMTVAATAFAAAPASAAAPHRVKNLERFALRLVNCTRTGGWVKADGTCKGYGSGRFSKYRKPLWRNRKLADEVTWPWAKRIVKANYCGHRLAGSDVDGRFQAAGFDGQHTGENVGCSNAWKAKKMIIRTHRMMQSEKSYNGWHWRQMKDKDFRSAGIAIAKKGRRTRIVVNFYGAHAD